MVVLFITYHIYHLIYRIILETQFCSTYILCHIDRCTIATEQKFLVQSFCSKVSPNRTILFSEEESFFQTFHHLLFTFQIGFRFVIYLVKTYSKTFVGFIKSGINPIVHGLPELTNLRIALFPTHQHIVRLFHQRRLLFSFCLSCFLSFFVQFIVVFRQQRLYFCTIMFIKFHVVIAYQMVTLFTC